MSLLAYVGSIALALVAGIIISPWVRDAWWTLDDRRRDWWREFLHPAHERQHADPYAWMAADNGQPSESREPATVPSALLASKETTAHADAMWQAGEPYLPPAPESQLYAPVPLALPWVPQERRQTEDHPPWTGEMPAITPELDAALTPQDDSDAEQDRLRYVRARLDECGPLPTTEQLREILGTLRHADVPAPASSFPCCRHCTPPCETHHVACIDCHPGFGADRCEADVLAAEDGAPVMLP